MSTDAKPRYERPSLVRHRSGLMNKLGTLPSLEPVDAIDGVTIAELVETYGSPLFVYSQQRIESKVRELQDALRLRYPRVKTAWSYKTCYLDAVCRVYHDEGSWAEVVSGMEYDKALRNGVPPEQIIFNGPHKTEADLARAFRQGATVNLDNFDELALAERVAQELDLQPSVGIRLNLSLGAVPRWGRFGFALESGQAWDAVRRLVGGGVLKLTGLHAHIGTFILDAAAYRRVSTHLAQFANRLRKELDIVVETIDVGGGFASGARLRSQYLPAEEVTPSLSQYAEAVTDGLQALDCSFDELPLLIVESGRALIDDAGTMIATVVANKRLPDGRRALVIDAGVNLLFTAYWYQPRLLPTAETHGVSEPTVVYGPLCMNIDVICNNMMLPPLDVGSRVLISPVGAYNVTQSMQFIHLRPAVAMISPSGKHAAIRRAETLDDIVGPESLPPWLDEESKSS